MNDVFVDDAGTKRIFPDRKNEPDESQDLAFVVEGQPEEEEVGKGLEEGEDGEHNPVRHPFDVLRGVLGAESLEGGIRRVEHVGDQLEGEHFGQQVRILCFL